MKRSAPTNALGPTKEQKRDEVWWLLAMAVLPVAGLLVAPRLLKRANERFESPVGEVKTDLIRIANGILQFVVENNGAFPPSLDALFEPNQFGEVTFEPEEIPRLDPWGNEYQYRPPPALGGDFELWSFGADGVPGGSGEDRDVYYRDLLLRKP